MGLGSMLRSCCWLGAVAGAVPLAFVVAVLLETPTTITLAGSSQGGGGTSGESANQAKAPAAAASAQSDFGKAGESGFGTGKMFDRIAFAYDSTNKWLSLGLDQHWRQKLLQDCVRLKHGDRMLDLATGTADVGILAGKALRELGGGQDLPASSVMGLDPSSEMLRHGVVKVEEQGLKGVVRLVKGDAQDLGQVRDIDAQGTLSGPEPGLESGSIDKITMSFGIRNVPDRSKALREMRRVLRESPSSRVCILELSLPSEDTFLSKSARAFIQHVVPFIGKVATMGSGSDEYKYLEASILKFPTPLDFAASMAREGLPVSNITSFAFGAVNLYSAGPA